MYKFRIRSGQVEEIVTAKTKLDACMIAFSELDKGTKLGVLTECHKEFESFDDITYFKTESVLEKMTFVPL